MPVTSHVCLLMAAVKEYFILYCGPARRGHKSFSSARREGAAILFVHSRQYIGHTVSATRHWDQCKCISVLSQWTIYGYARSHHAQNYSPNSASVRDRVKPMVKIVTVSGLGTVSLALVELARGSPWLQRPLAMADPNLIKF